MTKEEFVGSYLKSGEMISDKEFEITQTILDNYPFKLDDCPDKKSRIRAILKIRQQGGRALLDMYQTAQSAKLCRDRIQEIEVELRSLTGVLHDLEIGKVLSVSAVNGQLYTQMNPVYEDGEKSVEDDSKSSETDEE